MKKTIKFGEEVDGFDIPVLNEREIRAAAGILFLGTFLSLMFIVFKGNFVPIKYIITIFLADFLIRVFINPKFSPTLILGRLIVRNQTPASQFLTLLAFIAFIFLTIYFLNDRFGEKPYDLFGDKNIELTK
jgi:hypothetical protein